MHGGISLRDRERRLRVRAPGQDHAREVTGGPGVVGPPQGLLRVFHRPRPGEEPAGDQGAEAIITGNLGPRAAESLAALKIKVYRAPGGNAKAALEAFKAGKLQEMGGATVGQHFGMS